MSLLGWYPRDGVEIKNKEELDESMVLLNKNVQEVLKRLKKEGK